MGFDWTPEQKKVIESRNCSLLVSAAAGSGKTAVLVERIIRMITEGEHPFDIDQLLVMTFTKAAASEMKERVAEAIDQLLEKESAAHQGSAEWKEPNHIHLRVQAAMIPYAMIITIDSFCLNLIREHYNKLDLDPSFSVGEEGELVLMQADVMKELLEEYYTSGSEEFASFVEVYAQGKTDRGIDDIIRQVYTFSQSTPWPEKWIAQCRQELSVEDGQSLTAMSWMQFLLSDVKQQAEELAAQMEAALAVCEEESGPQAYLPMVTADIRTLRWIEKAADYRELNDRLKSVSFDRLASIRSKDVDPGKKEYVSSCRARMKKAVSKIRDQYGCESIEDILADFHGTAKPVDMLLSLTEEYAKRYQQVKKDKNIVDFNDLEHYCLKVLLREEDGVFVPTEIADQLSSQYEEVLVDEYQDSNEVQEALVQSISRNRFGTPNVFMVGDVKQSIYRFRLARPELFLEKYHTYAENSGLYQKIELHQNFRSRDTVLSGINEVFYRIMTEKLGNISYTNDTALHPGAVFEDCEGRAGEKSELLMVHTDGDLLRQMDEEMADYTSRELEARMIAGRIRELTDEKQGLLIWDKKEKAYRTVRLRDMVILLRSTSGWAEEFVNVLMNEGIPAYAELHTGYFTTLEVETVLSMLHIIDNPMQDIPLAAVMKSPVGGFTDEELADLMASYKKALKKGQDRGLYGAWKRFMADRDGVKMKPGLEAKLVAFGIMLDGLVEKARHLTIHELLYDIFETTGYYDYVSAMPAGDARRANLDMLVEKAAAFERTSYTGLFNFIRYIEKLRKYETDFGEASVAGEEDTVRIMSIHKSKGLEFPVVFLAGMGKKFNKQDAYGKLLIDPDLGIGTDCVDLERRLKSPTLKKQVLKRKSELDSLGEELRVLYVAMTRAKEKLIMTGTDRYLDRKLEKFRQVPSMNGQIPFTILASADSYLDWILMSLSGKLPETGMMVNAPADGGMPLDGGFETADMIVRQIPISLLIGREMVRQEGKRVWKKELLELDKSAVYDEIFAKQLKEAVSFIYPFAGDVGLHAKLSVSEIKKQSQVVEEESGYLQELLPLGEEVNAAAGLQGVLLEGRDSSIPQEEVTAEASSHPCIQGNSMEKMASDLLEGSGAFVRQVQSRGAFRGTAYHRFLELLDFSAVHSEKDVQKSLLSIGKAQRMEKESLELLDAATVYRFLQSPLGRRMAQAQVSGKLHKEQQFVIGIPAREMDLSDSDELVLVQGIIDAYFEEDGKLILMDYKTDGVKEEDALVKRYAIQLEYYKRALEQMTEQPVTEKWIYSFALGKEIQIIF